MSQTAPGKLATLRLDGSLGAGVRVILEIGPDGGQPYTEANGHLPAAPEIVQALSQWQQRYQSLQLVTRVRPKSIRYKGSLHQLDDCRQAAQTLKNSVVQWLESETFRAIDRRLREELSRDEPIRILLRTSDADLRQLPWHEWDLIERYPDAELALGGTTFESVAPRPALGSSNVRILAILGHRDGIDTEADRQALAALTDAEVVFLVEPQRPELNEHLWSQPWDILFFAGHSQTVGASGLIEINPTESLTIDELKYGLRRAIAQGLHLAIFNSCDGLGLADALKQLNLPQMILMRQPVPDRVAQQFLTHFLNAFSGGCPLYLAVRQAREQLQGLETEFPCASWLPVIYQHLTATPLDWQQLKGAPVAQDDSTVVPLRELGAAPVADGIGHAATRRASMRVGVLASVVVTGLVAIARWGGLFQAIELNTYDHWMQQQPDAAQDDRLLLVTIDDQDIQYQIDQGMTLQGSLSDAALATLLDKLQAFEPQSIGLDLYRPQGLQLPPAVADGLQSAEVPIFSICKVPALAGGDMSGIDPPVDLPINQIGFSDFVVDPDDVLRRQLLAIKNPSPASRCTASNAFSLLLALYYLESAEGITYALTPEREFQFNDVVLKRLTPNAGGYHNLDASGYQLLLRYRRRGSPHDIAPTLALRDVLSDRIPPASIEQLKGRIVLIGVTALSSSDTWAPPYSTGQTSTNQRIPGVIMQAQMVSQLLSAVLDGRRLVWWWPEWAEVLWIGAWALVGGLVGTVRQRRWQIGFAFVAFVALVSSGYGLMALGGWVPLVPAAIALSISLMGVNGWLWRTSLRKRQHLR